MLFSFEGLTLAVREGKTCDKRGDKIAGPLSSSFKLGLDGRATGNSADLENR
jgi:hypothetical protein